MKCQMVVSLFVEPFVVHTICWAIRTATLDFHTMLCYFDNCNISGSPSTSVPVATKTRTPKFFILSGL